MFRKLWNLKWNFVWLAIYFLMVSLPLLPSIADAKVALAGSGNDRDPSFFNWSFKRQMKKLRPKWSDPKFIRDSANESILNSSRPDQINLLRDPDLVEWLKPDQSPEMADLRIRYQQSEMNSDFKRSFGQNSVGEISRRQSERNELRDQALNQIRRARENAERQRFAKSPMGSDLNEFVNKQKENPLGTGQTGKRAVVTVAAIAAVSIGTPVVVNVSDDVRVFATTNFQDRKGELKVNSSAIESTVLFDGYAPMNVADPNRERLSLGVGRPLPIWSLRSDLNFGGSTQMMSASLSKQLAPNLVATLRSERTSGAVAVPLLRQPEESLSVRYEFRF